VNVTEWLLQQQQRVAAWAEKKTGSSVSPFTQRNAHKKDTKIGV